MATKKQAAASETSKSIEDQVAAYLKDGGKIQQIESGVSGQQSMAGPKHIKLGNSSEPRPPQPPQPPQAEAEKQTEKAEEK